MICSWSMVNDAASSGARTSASSMKSPSRASSSSPTGDSSDSGSREISRISSTRSAGRETRLPISSAVGSRPSSCIRSRWARLTLLMYSVMWTGMRMTRDWSAMARVMACRIHHVAYVENL